MDYCCCYFHLGFLLAYTHTHTHIYCILFLTLAFIHQLDSLTVYIIGLLEEWNEILFLFLYFYFLLATRGSNHIQSQWIITAVVVLNDVFCSVATCILWKIFSRKREFNFDRISLKSKENRRIPIGMYIQSLEILIYFSFQVQIWSPEKRTKPPRHRSLFFLHFFFG